MFHLTPEARIDVIGRQDRPLRGRNASAQSYAMVTRAVYADVFMVAA